MKAHELFTGKTYNVEIVRETKCYFIANLLNYRSLFRYPIRIHKKTMCISNSKAKID